MKLDSSAKRLGVFVFYDKDGLVDDYVTFMLDSLKESLNDLIIVSNCYLETEEKRKLLKYTDKVHIRQNIGLDAGAFKYIYDIYKDKFENYDELILLNDTFFGPFKPFKEIINDMNKKNVDFWGLTANYDSVDGYGFLPDNMIHSHIQTFFIAFRKNVLNSNAFKDYWDKYNIDKMTSFLDVVTKHELVLTNYLEKNGFRWDTYVTLDKYKQENIQGNFNIYGYCGFDLINTLDCPFIKRKNFVFNKKDSLYLNDGKDARRVLDYLKNNNIYDIDMIYKNLTRIYNANDLYYGLNLAYLVKESKNDYLDKVALVFFLNNEKYSDEYYLKLKRLNLKNVFIYTNNKTIEDKFKDYKINAPDKIIKKYEYLFVANDFDETSIEIVSPYLNMIDNIFENGLKSSEYINGVVDIFENNKYISLLLLPECIHSEYYLNYVNNSDIKYLKNACWIKSEYFNLDNNH